MRCGLCRYITFFSVDFSLDVFSLDLSRLCELPPSLSFLPIYLPIEFMKNGRFVKSSVESRRQISSLRKIWWDNFVHFELKWEG